MFDNFDLLLQFDCCNKIVRIVKKIILKNSFIKILQLNFWKKCEDCLYLLPLFIAFIIAFIYCLYA